MFFVQIRLNSEHLGKDYGWHWTIWMVCRQNLGGSRVKTLVFTLCGERGLVFMLSDVFIYKNGGQQGPQSPWMIALLSEGTRPKPSTGGFLKKRGTPKSYIYIDGFFMIFHHKPSSYWVPPWLWKPPTGMKKNEKPIPPNLSGLARLAHLRTFLSGIEEKTGELSVLYPTVN